ncbi:tripartite tricarboxylate transporter substrate binding protein [Xanthobacter sp. V4C-4]|uniref:Bug family tripartite tricarboxylate transporter substrate binding protein n=1 Tax=Xanthobacter cornucopiae TaxID=3119924 RepID=UPI00372A6359
MTNALRRAPGRALRVALLPALARAAALIATLAAPLLASPARAQEAYPAKPVRVVLPSPPGATNDIIARLVADKLGSAFHQKFVVENKPGGGGIIGVNTVAKAPADGYTLLVSFAGPLVVNIDPQGVDPARDLTPVTVIADLPYALVGNAELAPKTVPELIAASKTREGGLRIANSAARSDAHLLSELFRLKSGTNFVLVPYPGGGPAIKDLLGGHVDLLFTSFPAVAPHIAAGTLRPYAVATRARWPQYPDVPTLAEQGVPDVLASAWFGLLAPAGTPEPVLEALNRELAKAFADPEVQASLRKIGVNPRVDSRADSAAFIAAERAKWKRVLDEGGISLD